jgi:hypothetical protein
MGRSFGCTNGAGFTGLIVPAQEVQQELFQVFASVQIRQGYSVFYRVVDQVKETIHPLFGS